MDQPRYEHDCERCVWLGRYKTYDFWWCPSSEGPTFASVIGRWSSDGPDYISMHPPGAFAHPLKERAWYTEILRRAQERGLYDPAVAGYKPSSEPLPDWAQEVLKLQEEQ